MAIDRLYIDVQHVVIQLISLKFSPFSFSFNFLFLIFTLYLYCILYNRLKFRLFLELEIGKNLDFRLIYNKFMISISLFLLIYMFRIELFYFIFFSMFLAFIIYIDYTYIHI